MRTRRCGRGTCLLVGVLFGLLAAGCGGPAAAPPVPSSSIPAAPSGPTLPPRPVDLRLDGLDPCKLLTPAQRAEFGLEGPGDYSDNSDRFGSVACLWLRSTAPPYGGPLIRLVVRQDLRDELGSDQPETVIDINGFPAVQTRGSFGDPQRNCLVLVDMAPGQYLWTQYSKNSGPLQGLNSEVACAKTRQLAGYTLANVRAQLNK